MDPHFFWTKIIFWTKFFFGPKFFSDQKFLFDSKFLGPKFFLYFCMNYMINLFNTDVRIMSIQGINNPWGRKVKTPKMAENMTMSNSWLEILKMGIFQFIGIIRLAFGYFG